MKMKMQDLRLFNLVFESDASWILDFSNHKLSAFFDEEMNDEYVKTLSVFSLLGAPEDLR